MAGKIPPGPHTSVQEQVGADKRLGTYKGSSEPHVQELIEHVKTHGYVIIPGAFSAAEVQEAKSEVARLAGTSEAGPAAVRGRNTFEGLHTKRIYALINKSRIFDKFAIHPDVIALNDYFLNPGYLINAYHSISIQPGEAPQTLHHDDGFVTVPRPHAPFGTAIMIALDAYTFDNGATVIVPGSHLWGAERIPERTEAHPVTMPAGSVVYFLGTLWHGGGKNTSDHSRLALTVQYCQPWMRQLENQILAVDWDKLDEIPPRLVDMLGYKVGAPFVGYVDGRSPRTAVSRLLKRWQRVKGEDPKL